MGRRRHRHARGHRLHRAGPLADAGVARRDLAGPAPARRAQHGPRRRATTGRPHAAAATATTGTPCSRRWTWRKRSSSPSWRSTSPTVAQPGDDLRRLLPRAHHAVGGDRAHRLRPRCRRPTGRSTAPAAAPATPGSCRRSAPASSATPSATTSREHYDASRGRDQGDARGHRAAGRHRVRRRRRGRRRRVRHARPLRARRGAQPAGRGRQGRVGAPDHAGAVPDRRDRGRGRAGAGRRRLREQPGPDDRRRAPRRARVAAPSSSSAGSASTARDSASRPISRSSARCRRCESRRCSADGPSSSGHRGRSPTDRTAHGAGAARRRLHARAHRRSGSTTSAPAAASRSPCARRSRRSPSSAWSQRTIAVFGIGCYTAFSNNLDVEVLQALHGRAPSLATGVKRAKPDTVVFTVQGDGDMVNEGLQEVHPRRRPRREHHLHHAEQRRVRRDRRPHDRHHRARPAHQEHARRARRRRRTATRSG